MLALLPEFENRGIGRQLLHEVVSLTRDAGHTRLFLACSADPRSRSYGFYRHLGWQATGEVDEAGDEILELS
ncbi:Acetyltransferase (GNAT) family protein [compost metagenome]